MALTNTNNYITTLISTGNDAQSHLYEVTFEGGTLTDSVTTSMSIRCKGFKAPSIKQETYTQKYITAYIDRPKLKIDVERNFTLTFRTDDNWILYRALLDQQKIMSNAAHSYANSDITRLIDDGKLFNVRINIVKDLVEEGQETVRLFNFYHCWIEEIKPSGFKSDTSDQITVDCKINFMKMEDWQSGLTGDDLHGNSLLNV